MITIKKDIYNKLIKHSQGQLPIEACGYLAGKNGVITHSFELTNIDNSPEHFSFSPEEQFKTIKEARNMGVEIMANYHSHPETPARPSKEDIKLAFDPNIIYFIVSLADKIPEVKAFNIVDGEVTNLDISIS